MPNGRLLGCDGQCRFRPQLTRYLTISGAYAAVGQSGKVWFLAGTTGSGAVPPVVRTFTIPSGTPLFFPIVNYFWVNTPEYGDPAWSPDQETDVRNILSDYVDTATGLALEIDGRPVPNLYDYRFQSTDAKCTIPDDNIFGAPLLLNPYHCVADGYWVMLPPQADRIAYDSLHWRVLSLRVLFGCDLQHHCPT